MVHKGAQFELDIAVYRSNDQLSDCHSLTTDMPQHSVLVVMVQLSAAASWLIQSWT